MTIQIKPNKYQERIRELTKRRNEKRFHVKFFDNELKEIHYDFMMKLRSCKHGEQMVYRKVPPALYNRVVATLDAILGDYQ